MWLLAQIPRKSIVLFFLGYFNWLQLQFNHKTLKKMVPKSFIVAIVVAVIALAPQQSEALTCYECPSCLVPTETAVCQDSYNYCVTLGYSIGNYGT